MLAAALRERRPEALVDLDARIQPPRPLGRRPLERVLLGCRRLALRLWPPLARRAVRHCFLSPGRPGRDGWTYEPVISVDRWTWIRHFVGRSGGAQCRQCGAGQAELQGDRWPAARARAVSTSTRRSAMADPEGAALVPQPPQPQSYDSIGSPRLRRLWGPITTLPSTPTGQVHVCRTCLALHRLRLHACLERG